MVYFTKSLYAALAATVLAAPIPTRIPTRIPTTLSIADAPELEARAGQQPWHIWEDSRAHLTNGAQRVNEVIHTYKTDPANAGKASVTALIAGLDGQIDASLGTIFSIAHTATMGLSDPLANFILGPFFQSVTDGLEVVVGNAIGGGIDVAMSPMTGSLQKNVQKLIKQGKQYHMNTAKLANLSQQLQNTLPKREVELEARAGQQPWHIWEDSRAHLTNGAQRVNEVIHTYKTDPANAGKASVTALIAGLDGQIDASLGTMFSVAHMATMGLSDPLANFILGPFFQSVTDGLEVVVGNVIGGGIDVAMSPMTGSLQKNVQKLIKQGKQYHMNTAKLANLSQQLQNTLPKREVELEARAGQQPWHIWEDSRAHLTNGAQRVREVVNTYKNDPSNSGKATVTALIAGLDGQIDASLGTIFSIAHTATMGLSDPLANFILGPFFQSVTDGLEVVVGNAIGGGIDVAMSPMTGSLQKNVQKLIKQGKQYHMNTAKLANLSQQLQNTLPK